MPDTIRLLSELQTLLADNVTNDISPQDVRDFLVSVHPDFINVKAHGAVGNDTADDTTAIQDAADAAQAAGTGLYFPPGTYKTTATVTFLGNFAVRAHHNAVIKSYHEGVAVAVGSLTAGAIRGPHVYPSVHKATNSWVSSGIGSDAGIRIRYCVGATFFFRDIRDFSSGLLFDTTTTDVNNGYTAYNRFHLGVIQGNARQVHIKPTNEGWVNENTFIGGRFVTSQVNSETGTRQILIEDTSNHPPDHNVFIHPSIEQNSDRNIFYIDCDGSNNVWLFPRLESSPSPGTIRFGVGTNRNVVIAAYDDGTTWTNNGNDNVFMSFGVGKHILNMQFSGSGLRLRTVDDGTNGLVYTYPPGVDPSSLSAWTSKLTGNGRHSYKATGDAFARIIVDGPAAKIYFGNGTVAPTNFIDITDAHT